jgi:predicted RNA methylase
MSVDAIFTPPEMAMELVSCAGCKSPKVIADFCAGDGGLLRAASARWPKAKVIATDLLLQPLKTLKRRKSARIGKCDFLNERSRRACSALQGALSNVDLILLNPPFSHRGSRTFAAHVDNTSLTCSPALAFVVNCVRYLSRAGEIVAILPAGCIRSEKNDAAWDWLDQRFKISITAINNNRTFNGCFPTTVVARFQLRSSRARNRVAEKSGQLKENLPILKLLRGSIPMHLHKKLKRNGKVPFVHTTELHGNRANLKARVVNSARASVGGEFVVLPRVGQPSVSKLACLSAKEVAFSDCILGVECGSKRLAGALFLHLQRSWHNVARLYQGTGAPYVTVRDFAQLLRDSGYSVRSYHNGTSSGLFKKALSKQSSRRSSLLTAGPDRNRSSSAVVPAPRQSTLKQIRTSSSTVMPL